MYIFGRSYAKWLTIWQFVSCKTYTYVKVMYIVHAIHKYLKMWWVSLRRVKGLNYGMAFRTFDDLHDLIVLWFQCHILVGCFASFFNQVREPTQPPDSVEMFFFWTTNNYNNVYKLSNKLAASNYFYNNSRLKAQHSVFVYILHCLVIILIIHIQ